MELKLNIGLAELMQLITQLPKVQRDQLQAWMAEEDTTRRKQLKEMLLRAPTCSEAQVKRMAQVREAIDRWR